MYNFNFLKNEKLISIFDEVLVKQADNDKIVTIALTDRRLLFLDYLTDDGIEVLRIARGVNFTRYKDVCYEINLNNIKEIDEDKYYRIILQDEMIIEFNNEDLYKLLKKEITL